MCKIACRPVHTNSQISGSASHKLWSSLFRELCSAFTRSFYSYQLLVMVIKYIPSARHQLLGSGAPQRGLAGSWGWGGVLLAWLAWRLLSWLWCMRRRSSRPRQSPAQLQRRAEKCCGAWLRGALAGRASSCLPGSHWMMELLREARTPQPHFTFLSLSVSLSSEVSRSDAGSLNNTAFP